MEGCFTFQWEGGLFFRWEGASFLSIGFDGGSFRKKLLVGEGKTLTIAPHGKRGVEPRQWT